MQGTVFTSARLKIVPTELESHPTPEHNDELSGIVGIKLQRPFPDS